MQEIKYYSKNLSSSAHTLISLLRYQQRNVVKTRLKRNTSVNNNLTSYIKTSDCQ